jgi:hypothetical protein
MVLSAEDLSELVRDFRFSNPPEEVTQPVHLPEPFHGHVLLVMCVESLGHRCDHPFGRLIPKRKRRGVRVEVAHLVINSGPDPIRRVVVVLCHGCQLIGSVFDTLSDKFQSRVGRQDGNSESLGYSLYDLAKDIYGLSPVFLAYRVSSIADQRLQSCVEVLRYCETRDWQNCGIRIVYVPNKGMKDVRQMVWIMSVVE